MRDAPQTRSELLSPRPSLAGCVFAAIARDTRGAALSEAERFNHFPASPLVALTAVIEGETRLARGESAPQAAKDAPALPPVSAVGPHLTPMSSWNPGPIAAVSIGFYPEAWSLLTGAAPEAASGQLSLEIPPLIEAAAAAFFGAEDAARGWDGFQDRLEPLWRDARNEVMGGAEGGDQQDAAPFSAGARRIADWSRWMIAQAALSSAGRSARAMERRLRRWTGQNRQALSFLAAIEDLHARVAHDADPDLAQLALEAGYSDQSHMGRAVRRATGFSPARLNRLIATHEAFWCYRLMGERY